MKIEKKNYTTSIQHIDTIIADIEDHIQYNQDFVAFILIALGIEFLGSFFDDKEFNDFGQSKIRFKNAISNLFKNNWYKNNSDWLFEDFRGPLIHQYRTGHTLLLTSVCKNKAPISDHLKLAGNKRIFILQQLFEDFKLAGNKLKNISQNKSQNKIKSEKIHEEYLSIYNVNNVLVDYERTTKPTLDSYNSSGTTEMPSHVKLSFTNEKLAKGNTNIMPKKKKRKNN